jgi:hypothetical protein
MTTAQKAPAATKSAAQQLEEQKARHQALVQRRTKVQVELESAARQYAEAQAEAQREFGTGDLEELRALYLRSEAENERAVQQFAKELDALETAVADAEQQLVS